MEIFGKLSRQTKRRERPKPFWKYVKSFKKGTNDLVLLKQGAIELSTSLCNPF